MYFWKPFDLWLLTIHPLWLLVPASLGFAGCFCLSYRLHWFPHSHRRPPSKGTTNEPDNICFGPGPVSFPWVLSGLCTILWAGTAIFYHRVYPNAGIPYFLAFIAVMALESFLWFSIIMLPGMILMGWEQENQAPKSTLASLLVLLIGLSTVFTGSATHADIVLFQPGCLFMGAFVYYLGLLVMSSRWYSWQPRLNLEQTRALFKRYRIMQAITIISGFAAWYLGSTFHIGVLLGVGGTFFTIYLIEKYYEIPWKGVGWIWSSLGISVALYFFVGFAAQHPQYFIWGIRQVHNTATLIETAPGTALSPAAHNQAVA